jgi:uncharacterized membrane protein
MTGVASARVIVAPRVAAAQAVSARLAPIDWMRGLAMVLMVIDHASMAFDGTHNPQDSAMYPGAATMALPAGEFLTRWITHICAPTFVFLAGTSLALSVERKMAKGISAWEIDKFIMTRGAFIALLDPTIVSLGSGRWTFQVLFAIGLAMICMAALRRLHWIALLTIGLAWFAVGEIVTGMVWHPPGSSSPLAAFLVGTYGSDTIAIKYPLVPWLAIMMLGWAFGRHLARSAAGTTRFSSESILWVGGTLMLIVFIAVRGNAGYGDMFLHRSDMTWQQWLHVSKYPPSLTYASLEVGLLWLCLAALMRIEPVIGVRWNGVFLVFGQTSMFFYLIHRLAFEVPATYFGLRGVGDLTTTYVVAAVLLVSIYPACRWYRALRSAHPTSVLKYI